MHPVANIRGTASHHLAGRRIVLAVSGSIAAVKAVELARELVRHGADVQAVMSGAAAEIIHPNALEFGTGNPVITRLTGQVEHVALLGDVPGRADLLLVAPATANTVGKMAWGIDDTPVTTCATVAFGTGVPVVVAPAMHDAMMQHPKVAENVQTLLDMGVTWVEPKVEEKKAKLADVEDIVEAVIHRLATRPAPGGRLGPLAGKHALVVGGATAEAVDPIRILTNRSSGKSAQIIARELRRLGAEVKLWYGYATEPVAPDLADATQRFQTHADLMEWATMRGDMAIDQVWMPAAIADYVPEPSTVKIPSGQDGLSIPLRPVGKVIAALREAAPDAAFIAFKAETDASRLLERARRRLLETGARHIIANTADTFGSDTTEAHVLSADGRDATFEGDKEEVLREIVAYIADDGETAELRVAP